jgi:two-component system, NarL family, sensor kinase
VVQQFTHARMLFQQPCDARRIEPAIIPLPTPVDEATLAFTRKGGACAVQQDAMKPKAKPMPKRSRPSRPPQATEFRETRVPKAPGALRRAAEARLREKTATRPSKSEGDPARLQHDLKVHEIELKMQNEELRRAQVQLETALEQYAELYDFAPAGYLTLGRDGSIRRANLTAAGLLWIDRSQLLRRRFGVFVAAEDRPAFANLLTRAFETRAPQSGEARLWLEGKPPLTIHLRAWVSKNDPECRLVLTDLTERIDAEATLRQSDRFTKSALDALTAHIAVVDAQGVIVAVNEAWRRFARENASVDPAAYLGANYLTVCEKSHRRGEDESAEAVLQGLRAVIAGKQAEFVIEYPCHSPNEQRWFSLRVTRFAGQGPARLVLAHENITERKRAEESLHLLSARLLQLRDEERRHIARELHDSTVQDLAAVVVNLSFLRKAVRRPSPEARQALLDSLALADRAATGLRTLTYLLHPPLLEELGLEGALRDFVDGFTRRSGIRVDLELKPEWRRMPEDIELALFRVIQESLANIHRHSGSDSARIALRQSAAEVRLEVRDVGHGFVLKSSESAGRAPALGVGITGMRERLRELGGRLEIISNSGGTIVRATLPRPRPESGNPP